jgi:hypothetical protein
MRTAPSEPTLQDIHDLAANYSDRQGLRVVPVGLAVMVQAFPEWVPPSLSGIDTSLIALVAGFAGYWAAGRYYRRRFGAIDELPYDGMSPVAQFVAMFASFIAAAVVDLLLHPPVFISGLVIAAWLAIAAWPSRLVRSHYMASAIVLALIAFAPLTGTTLASAGRSYGFCFGFMLLLAGVRDHMAFVAMFPPPLREQHE